MSGESWTAGELAEILRKNKTTIMRRAEKEGWPFENGDNREKKYLLEELPAEVQEAINRYRMGIDRDSVEEMARAYDIRIPAAKLNDPKMAAKVRMVCECLSVPQGAKGRDRRIGEIAESHGYHKGTAYKLMKRVRRGKDLIKHSRNHGHQFEDLGITLRAWDPEAGRMAIEMILENRRNHVEKLYIYKDCKERAKLKGLRVGSYRGFLDLCSRVGPAITAYRDRGARGLREDIIPSVQRDFTVYRPMECLIGDQHKADYKAFDLNGEVATLELFCFLDFRTQMAWGSIAYKHYNRYTVGQALTNAVAWGLPGSIYTDWGKPEQSEYVSLLLEQLGGLGIKTQDIHQVNARVRNPQAKPIEGWYGHLDKRLKNKRLPGYCKRLRDSRESELQEKELTEEIRAGRLLSVDEMVSEIFSGIEDWNEHQFKNRGPDNGKSPMQIYNEETRIYPVTTLARETLDYIFLPTHPTTVRRSQVRIKHPWLPTLTYYDPDLANHTGESVIVRYNPFEAERVWVFETGNSRAGRLICCAEEWGMINPKNRDQVMDRLAKQSHLLKQVRERYRAYAPEKSITRISPHDRQANEVKREKVKREKAMGDLRVMRTPLDEVDMETGEVLVNERGYRTLNFVKRKSSGARSLIRVDWDRPYTEDEG